MKARSAEKKFCEIIARNVEGGADSAPPPGPFRVKGPGSCRSLDALSCYMYLSLVLKYSDTTWDTKHSQSKCRGHMLAAPLHGYATDCRQ